MSRVAAVLADRLAGDPLTAALAVPLQAAVAAALDEHLPRLAFSSREVADMLGVGTSTVNELVRDGQLARVAGPQSPISIGSLLAMVGWPMAEAPVVAPVSVVPTVGERAS